MNNDYTYRFGNIRERDIDVLLLNSFAMDPAFIDLFIAKISEHHFEEAKVLNIELSKTHPVWGESDVTVIFESEARRYALLIEDKVGADAQPAQCSRYFNRGDIGVQDGDYDEYFVFICAADAYISTNKEAAKYPYSLSFEELRAYFASKTDLFGKIRYEEMQQALTFAKTPYKKIVDAKATEFWSDYVEYARVHYPDLQVPNHSKEKSYNGDWPVYNTPLNYWKKVYIQHKMDRGIIDLTFSGMACRKEELREFLLKYVGDYKAAGFEIELAGKSAVLRKDFVKELGPDYCLSFQKTFESQIDIAKKHFEALHRLNIIAASFDYDETVTLITSGI